ncbi:hypothetical protein BDK51DRAFT_30062, partial [Blyttiomyces helicus]
PGAAYSATNSFAELAKHENRGFTFARLSTRLEFQSTESPGPCSYSPAAAADAANLHSDSGNGPAVMTLAPCTRLTDEIVRDCVKQNVPGPGAYQIKTPLEDSLSQRRNRINFGEGGDHRYPAGYMNQAQLKTPGPGAYYPEFSQPNKPAAVKPQPFGSTTQRFENTKERRAEVAPAPGSYDIDQIDSMVRRVQKRSQFGTGVRSHAFGSLSERFQAPRTKNDPPGPGAYAPSADTVRVGVPAPSDGARSLHSRAGGPIRGPVHVLVGNLLAEAGHVHSAVFGSQTERFRGAVHSDLPPPGAYEIGQAFETMKTKGRIAKTSVLVSQMPREVFPVKEDVPGPGVYVPQLLDRKETRVKNVGGFLSSETRFSDRRDRVPGPGAYLSASPGGLVRKTFNVTLVEWPQQQQSGQQQQGQKKDVGRVAAAS